MKVAGSSVMSGDHDASLPRYIASRLLAVAESVGLPRTGHRRGQSRKLKRRNAGQLTT